MYSQLSADESSVILSATDQGWIPFPDGPYDEGDIQLLAGMENRGLIRRESVELNDGFSLTILGHYRRCGLLRQAGSNKVNFHDRILRTGIALANEIECLYRYQIETVPIAPVDEKGILKARLLAATFAAAAYIMGRCAESPREANEFTIECISIAMQPLIKLGDVFTSPYDGAAPIADPFVSKLLFLIRADFVGGVLHHQPEAFQQIVQTYHQCFAESLEQQQLPDEFRSELDRMVESFVGRLFDALDDLLYETLQTNCAVS